MKQCQLSCRFGFNIDQTHDSWTKTFDEPSGEPIARDAGDEPEWIHTLTARPLALENIKIGKILNKSCFQKYQEPEVLVELKKIFAVWLVIKVGDTLYGLKLYFYKIL